MLIAVIAYELVVIVGIGLWMQRSHDKNARDEFSHANRSLPVPVVAVTLALTVLGTAHILGVFEMAWILGASAVWFSLAHVILLVVVCLGTVSGEAMDVATTRVTQLVTTETGYWYWHAGWFRILTVNPGSNHFASLTDDYCNGRLGGSGILTHLRR